MDTPRLSPGAPLEPWEQPALLRALGTHAQKRLGQHFLISPTVLARIVEAADLQPTDAVIEVGPGLGVLTGELVRRAGRVIAVELDRNLADLLQQHFGGSNNLEVVRADILTCRPAALVGPGASYKVVANLPYYITSAALRHFLDAPLRPRLMVVMVQEEVGRRIVAKPPRLSLLAVSVQYYGVPRLVDIVPASAFYPQPHVRSAILRIDVYEQPPYDVPSADILFATVAAGFSQPRKQVHNSLAHALSLDAAIVAEALTAAGVSGDRRPSTLSLDEWAAVTRALAPFLVGHPDVLRRQRKRGTQ